VESLAAIYEHWVHTDSSEVANGPNIARAGELVNARGEILELRGNLLVRRQWSQQLGAVDSRARRIGRWAL
jgi:hypothetical protein